VYAHQLQDPQNGTCGKPVLNHSLALVGHYKQPTRPKYIIEFDLTTRAIIGNKVRFDRLGKI
jgi:hypothetical protein